MSTETKKKLESFTIELVTQDTGNVWYLLNDREKQLVRQLDMDYFLRWGQDPASDPNLCYFLGDRYEFSRTWSAISRAIPTYRKNTGKFIFRQKMVFLSQKDKLASLGWPVSSECAEAMGTAPLPALDPARADIMAGNSMHFTCAAVVLLLGLTCFAHKEAGGSCTDDDSSAEWWAVGR